MNAPPDITAIILAGGQDRSHGTEKGLVHFCGRPVLEHTLAAVKPQVRRVVISADSDLDQYRDYGCPVVCDTPEAASGPLAGILAVLQQTTDEYVLTVPCDAPNVCADYAARMYYAVRDSAADAAVAHDGTMTQPVFALLRRSLLTPLQEFLEQGGRRARVFLVGHHALEVDFSDCPEMFGNLDHTERTRANRMPDD